MEKKLNELYLKALEGFLLIIADQGDIVYLSENISKYLGPLSGWQNIEIDLLLMASCPILNMEVQSGAVATKWMFWLVHLIPDRPFKLTYCY